MGKKSFSGKSASDGRTGSITSGDTEKSNVRQREHMGAAIPTTLQTETEAEGDDDVGNGEYRMIPLGRETTVLILVQLVYRGCNPKNSATNL